MPSPTAFGIINRFKKFGRREPLTRGSKAVLYDSRRIMKFVTSLLSKSISSNFTLNEIRYEIEKRRLILLSPGCRAPSINWISHQLRFSLHWTRKVATVEPARRNCNEILLERHYFAKWLESLSEFDTQRYFSFNSIKFLVSI